MAARVPNRSTIECCMVSVALTGLVIYTIGHSNRPLDEFLEILQAHSIKRLADIRSLPGSAKYPHFNSENLADTLAGVGIDYVWIEKLGGRRRKIKGFDSPNSDLYSPAFRNYADYMLGEEFTRGVSELIEIASASRTACMCAEALFWRCHRRLLSDYLSAHGIDVRHIFTARNIRSHTMSRDAVVRRDGRVIYPAAAMAGRHKLE